MDKYQQIYSTIQKSILRETLISIPNLKGKILKKIVTEIVKIIRIERAKAKNELVERFCEEIDFYSIDKGDEKLVNLNDLKFVARRLGKKVYIDDKF